MLEGRLLLVSVSEREGCFSVVDGAVRLGDTEMLFVLDLWLTLPVLLLAVMNCIPGCGSKGLRVIYRYKVILTGGYEGFKEDRCHSVRRAVYLVMNASN